MDFDRSYGPIPTAPSDVTQTAVLDRQTFEVSSEVVRLGNGMGLNVVFFAFCGVVWAALALGVTLAVATGTWAAVVVVGVLASVNAVWTLGVGIRVLDRLRDNRNTVVTVTALTLELPRRTVRFSDVQRLEGSGAQLAVLCSDGQRIRLGRMPGLEPALRRALGRFAVERGASAESERERDRVDGLRGMNGAL